MQVFVCAVRDRAADVFGQPMFFASVAIGTRSFGDAVNSADNPMNKHPEDYDLFLLGTYDDQEGSFQCHKPKQIAIGKDMYRKEG